MARKKKELEEEEGIAIMSIEELKDLLVFSFEEKVAELELQVLKRDAQLKSKKVEALAFQAKIADLEARLHSYVISQKQSEVTTREKRKSDHIKSIVDKYGVDGDRFIYNPDTGDIVEGVKNGS
jgi:hypothetical protein